MWVGGVSLRRRSSWRGWSFFSSRRRHTRCGRDWSSDVCSSDLAKRRCPDLIFVRPRFDVYREASTLIRAIFYDYTDLVEPLSLDEAYLDITHQCLKRSEERRVGKECKCGWAGCR